jgi:hypothetical protein
MLEARQPRHCRHCWGGCPGDCLLDDGQCIHGWNGNRPQEFSWRVLLTRPWWERLLWGDHGNRRRAGRANVRSLRDGR